ncbi:MAG: Hsp20/alpha crystallin family protein [Ginsengibacter sp.]|jgi:HSP20 family protein
MTQLRFNQPGFKAIDQFFESILNETPSTQKRNGINFPAVNIVETDNNYELELNVPGRKKDDFKITLEKDLLTISFEKAEAKTEDTKKFIKKEFFAQSFSRSFTLDEKINIDQINAKYEDGILMLTLPKKEEVKIQPKEITIQ